MNRIQRMYTHATKKIDLYLLKADNVSQCFTVVIDFSFMSVLYALAADCLIPYQCLYI